MAVVVDAVVGALFMMLQCTLLFIVACVAFETCQGAGTPAAFTVRKHVVVGPATDRALVATAHPWSIRIEVVCVEAVVPGGLLVVLGAHGAEDSAWFIKKGSADLFQGILDHARGEDLFANFPVVLFIDI